MNDVDLGGQEWVQRWHRLPSGRLVTTVQRQEKSVGLSDSKSMIERLEVSNPDIAVAFRELLKRYAEACAEVDRLLAILKRKEAWEAEVVAGVVARESRHFD